MGGWHQVDTPAAGPRGSDLFSVSCLDAKTCWALGDKFIAHHEVAEMTWKFSHGEWRERGLPDVWKRTHKGEVGVDDLSCTTKRCFAVGIGRGGHAAAWSWSPGGSWQQMSVHVSASAQLTSVSCAGKNSCVALGHLDGPHGLPHPVAVQFRGHGGWRQLARPAKATAHTHWMDVSCATADACYALGTMLDPHDGVGTVDMIWRRSAAHWHRIGGIPKPTDRESLDLTGLSCPATGHCVTVGTASSDNGGGTHLHRAYAARLAHGAWQEIDTHNDQQDPESVVCQTKTLCRIIGDPGHTATVAGARWTSETLADPIAIVRGADCPTKHRCRAVGYTYDYSTRPQASRAQRPEPQPPIPTAYTRSDD